MKDLWQEKLVHLCTRRPERLEAVRYFIARTRWGAKTLGWDQEQEEQAVMYAILHEVEHLLRIGWSKESKSVDAEGPSFRLIGQLTNNAIDPPGEEMLSLLAWARLMGEVPPRSNTTRYLRHLQERYVPGHPDRIRYQIWHESAAPLAAKLEKKALPHDLVKSA